MAKPGPRTTYRYSREFKATAVRLSQLPGVAVGDVADSLYIHPLKIGVTISPPLSTGPQKRLPGRACRECTCIACNRAGGVFG
jgi:hypothetical protein